MTTYRAIVGIISLVIYFPALATCSFLVYAQGPGNNAAHVWLAIFCCIRITGFGLQVYAEENNRNSNTTYYTGVAVLLNIGLSPLLLASVGMLSRVDGAVGRRMACTLVMIAIPILLHWPCWWRDRLIPRLRRAPRSLRTSRSNSRWQFTWCALSNFAMLR